MKQLLSAAVAAALGIGLAATPAFALGVGDQVKHVEQVEEFTQIGAETWADLQGRAVLVEFFAYW